MKRLLSLLLAALFAFAPIAQADLRATAGAFGPAVVTSGTIDGAVIGGTTPAAGTFTTLTHTAQIIGPRQALTYSASITPNGALANNFVISATNATAFTINATTNLTSGQEVGFLIRNTSGGVLGAITWNAQYKMATFTAPANGFSRYILFLYDGTNLVQILAGTVDVPN